MNIVFEDKFLLIIEKAPSELSEPDGSGNDVITLSAQHTGHACFPVHRLDRGTGGIMIVAKTKDAAARLSSLVQNGGIAKQYLAVIHGCPPEAEGEYRDLLFKDAAKNKSYVVERMRRGVKEAVLTYRVLEKGEQSLVSITLQTGRTHQIRVQFSSRKMPLVGDGKYGSRDNRCGTALWSHRISFVHPFTKKSVSFTSAPPKGYPWDQFSANQ